MPKKVIIVCNWLFNDNLEISKGGSQRYVIELSRLFISMKWEVKIFQKSFKPFKTQILDKVEVEGIKTIKNWLGLPQFSYKVNKRKGNADFVIFVYQESAFPFTPKNSIAIQHGLNWSGNNKKQSIYNSFFLQPFLLRKLKSVVCVDTAYINWVHTQIGKSDIYAEKLKYIPNFVDNQKHTEKAKWVEEDSQKVVLFPRRMVAHRGAQFAYEAMKLLWKKGKSYKIVFCGPGPLTEEIEKDAVINNHSSLIEIYQKDFEEMPAEYAKAQVAIIPTLAFEGTSLSCIEAMASGLPVITTHIGGLGNLVIPGFNGHCINLNIGELADSIEKILDTENVWHKFSKRGIETAKQLDISIWQKKWKDVISKK